MNALLGLSGSTSCELDVSLGGIAAGVAVDAGVYGKLSMSAQAGLLLSSSLSSHVTAQADTVGVPPALAWRPNLSFSRPQVTTSKQKVLDVDAGIGIGVTASLGNGEASANVDYGDTWTFAAKPGACSWTATYGQFTAEGKLFGWTIKPPDTQPVYTNKFWQDCTDSGGNPGGGSSGWTIQSTPNPTGTNSSHLAGVSCTSASACTAVGYYYNSKAGGYAPLAVRWNGSRWTIQGAANAAGAGNSYLDGVSCT